MSILCVINTNLVFENDIGHFLNGEKWDMITLSRCMSFPCLPPVGTTIYLECEYFDYLVVEEICFFEKTDRAGDQPAFHLDCEDQELGIWKEGPGSARDFIESVEEYLADGWFLGESTDTAKTLGRWKKYVEEHEENTLEKKVK